MLVNVVNLTTKLSENKVRLLNQVRFRATASNCVIPLKKQVSSPKSRIKFMLLGSVCC